MSSEGMSLVPPPSQRLDGGLNSQLLFQDDALRFSCGPPQQRGDPGPKTRELSGFINDRYGQPQPEGLPDFRRGIFGEHHRLDHNQDRIDWNGNGRTSSGDGSEEDEEEEDDDDEDDDDGVHERGIDHKNSGDPLDGDGFSFGKSKHISPFGVGTSRGLILEEGSDSIIATRADLNDSHQQEQIDQYQSAVTIADAEGDLYYSQYLQGQEVLGGGRQKDVVIENGCGFSGRTELGESLRVILSDPITGALMDDAMILPCGHSFGGGGVQHVIRIKACCTCSQPVSEESILPNLSLRAAIQAFQREEELHVHRSSKRRRERYEQDKGYYGDSTPMDHHHPRGRGVQFPFVVTDRVIIKGNKRTPLRFVGREAIVTTQCLNGWYVVKTLDNAESVKLQYRSLAKVSDNPSSKPALVGPAKMTPNWL